MAVAIVEAMAVETVVTVEATGAAMEVTKSNSDN
jgi:hypothetical protein